MTLGARSNPVCFGPFEVDLRIGELRKNGTKVRLEGQPIQILALLLESPGELVTQDEIRRKLWPDGTVVEYEHSIKTALRKLRNALGDEADAPRYIETLPRRGYRFVASVNAIQVEGEAAAGGASVPAPADGATAKRSPLALAGLTGTLLTALAFAVYLYVHRAPPLNEKDTIVLADFANTTGDAVFDDALRQGLAVQLEQSPFLSLISEAQIQQTLRMMGQPPDVRLTPAIARDLCQRTGSIALIDGSIANLGSQYVLGLKALECRTGDSLAEEQVTADSKEQVLRVLGEAATKLRRKLGESISTVVRFDTPIEQATTPSLEALQAYSLGMKYLIGKSDFVAALPLFQRAIRLDPRFASAFSGLALTYINLAETDLAAKSAARAYELREGVSEREKFLIEASYFQYATGDLEKARQTCELWAQTYPRDDFPRGIGIGIYFALGKYDRALEEARANLKLAPGIALGYGALVMSYLALNRLPEARATADDALGRDLDSPLLREDLYALAFLRNDATAMAEQLAWGAGKPGAEDFLLAMESHTAAYTGHLSRSRDLSVQAVASAERAEEKEAAALYKADAAQREALFGNPAQARALADGALALSTGRDVEYGTALALALCEHGAEEQARIARIADDLARRFPEDTLVRFIYVPTIRAQLAVNSGRSSKAIEALQASAAYELGTGGGFGFSSTLFSVYVRGLAYLAAHHGKEAAAEFQKILDCRNVVLNEPIGALAHLGLGRAYAMEAAIAQDMEDTRFRAKSRSAYQDFLVLWKDADPDIALLKRVRNEYANFL
jgi:DNA-binding winged helix-turn-helix (wHTH) protein